MPFQFERILPEIRAAKRVICLGYPDLCLTDEYIAERELPMVTERNLAAVKYHQSLPLDKHGPPETVSYFKALGAKEVVCVDLYKHRGDEVVLDFNTASGLEIEPADLVIDPGSIEHCMNPLNAIRMAANLTKTGGTVYHTGCFDGWFEHGFFMVQPCWFHVFYEVNKWESKIEGYRCPVVTQEGAEVGARMFYQVLAKKSSESTVYETGIQHKYRPKK
jgi:hypothetical protein